MDLSVLDNENVALGLAMFIAVYGYALARTELPKYIKDLFNNDIFKVVFLSLMLIANFNKLPHVAVTVALIFVLTLNYMNEQEIKERFSQ